MHNFIFRHLTCCPAKNSPYTSIWRACTPKCRNRHKKPSSEQPEAADQVQEHVLWATPGHSSSIPSSPSCPWGSLQHCSDPLRTQLALPKLCLLAPTNVCLPWNNIFVQESEKNRQVQVIHYAIFLNLVYFNRDTKDKTHKLFSKWYNTHLQ